MPLLKSILTESGVPATYWRLGDVHVNVPTKTAWAQIEGFFNQAAADTGAMPLETKKYYLPYEALASHGPGVEGFLMQPEVGMVDIPENERVEGGPTQREAVIDERFSGAQIVAWD